MSAAGGPERSERGASTNAVTRLGVAGWPVGHSRSPVMQNAALAAVGLGEGWNYQHLPVPPELFTQTVGGLPGSGFRGVNVTIPHKAAALALADHMTARASAIGAANTLVFQADGSVSADNTDAPALTGAIADSLAGGVHGSRVLVLGAGGSGRAAVWALTDAGAASVSIWNRTHERAVELAHELDASAVTGGELPPVDVIINCTSVGLTPGDRIDQLPVDAAHVAGAALVVDFVYSPVSTPLELLAGQSGAAFIGGLELLVRQGAESFTQFTGIPAPLGVMRLAVAGHSTN